MTKYNQDIKIHQGESRRIIIPVKKADGTAKDLTGAEAIDWVVFYQDTELIHLTLLSGITTPVPTDGNVYIELDHEQTTPLDAGGYEHELWVTDGAGYPALVTTGAFTVEEGHRT